MHQDNRTSGVRGYWWIQPRPAMHPSRWLLLALAASLQCSPVAGCMCPMEYPTCTTTSYSVGIYRYGPGECVNIPDNHDRCRWGEACAVGGCGSLNAGGNVYADEECSSSHAPPPSPLPPTPPPAPPIATLHKLVLPAEAATLSSTSSWSLYQASMCVDGIANGGCSDTCTYASDAYCDDGGPGSEYDWCALGTDCSDCGTRHMNFCHSASGDTNPSLTLDLQQDRTVT